MLSLQKGNTEVAEFILNNGADLTVLTRDGNTPLFLAITKGYSQLVEIIIQLGGDVNAKTRDGNNPLLEASGRGYLSVVKRLIERGARLDASQKDGTNAAYVAAQNGHLDVLKILIQHDTNLVDLKGYKGRTPVFAAATIDTVKYLVSLSNISVTVQDDDGLTPFIAANKNGHPDVAEYLFSVQWNITLPKGKFVRITLITIFHEKQT